MPKSQIALQLYTLRNFAKTPADIAKTIKKVRQIGYEVVELAGLGAIKPEELKKITDDNGVTICSAHDSYQQMRDETQSIIDKYSILGCKHLGCGIFGERSAEGYAKFAKEASEVAKKLAKAGIALSYHNHSFELEKYDGRTGLEILYAESDPKALNAQIDVFWIQHGGGDPAAWIKKLSGRTPTVHLKDMVISNGKQLFAEVGEGNLNWPAILDACKESGVLWYIVEQDTCQRDPFESVEISFKNLKKMGLK